MNQDVLNYKHPGVIRRFQRENPDLHDHAEEIFSDLMKFFWAGRKHEDLKAQEPHNQDLDFIYIMDEEMKPIDVMWHTFLLYTKDYMNFCDTYFGEYLHHLPDIVENNLDQDPEKFKLNLERFLSFTFDHLGEDVIRRWYAPHLSAT